MKTKTNVKASSSLLSAPRIRQRRQRRHTGPDHEDQTNELLRGRPAALVVDLAGATAR